MKKEEIQIILPPTASSDRELDLVNLTEFLSKKFDLDTSFGLGGEYGYGVDFENDTFFMKPFCWCEQDDCDWCAMNDKKLQNRLFAKYGDKKWSEWGYAPNFWHKKSGLMVRWYKWIGRDNEYSKKITDKEWRSLLQDCIKSIGVSKTKLKGRKDVTG